MFRILHLTASLLCLSSAIIVTNCYSFTSGGRVVTPFSEYSSEVVWTLNAPLARQAKTRNVKGLSGGKQNSNNIG